MKDGRGKNSEIPKGEKSGKNERGSDILVGLQELKRSTENS